MITSILAVVALSAASAATAAAQEAEPHFSYCGEKGGATWLYGNNLCSTDRAGTGGWELLELPLATLLAISSEVVVGTSYKLASEALGVKVSFECSSEHGTGWIENPAGGGPGIDLSTDSFSSCTVQKPSGCTIAEPIEFKAKTELAELEGGFWDRLTPDGATTFVEVELKTCGLLNNKYKITGKTAAKIHNETGIQSFNSEMDELKFAGNKASFEGESLVLSPAQAPEPHFSNLPPVTLLAISSEALAGTSYKLTSEVLGEKVSIECSKERGTGWIENPATGGPGIDLTTSSFSACTVQKPSGCIVAEPIQFTSGTELAELEGAFWDVLRADGGTTIATIGLESCEIELLDGRYKVTGKTAGKIHNETGIQSFNSEMDELKFAGNKASFEGESLVLTDGGEAEQASLSAERESVQALLSTN